MNYAWINYGNEYIEFVDEQWANEQIKSINILSGGQDYYDSISVCDTWDKLFQIIPNRRHQIEYWLKNGTWEVSPIILDCNSFPIKPKGVEINGKYQLVEGHTRTGILNSLIKINMKESFNLNNTHKVWIMRNKLK
ncbi:hypothetical protein [Arcicella rosea]|uniref:Uncharacterized protein n=1 Tax=Arcicella rosea TaxID=502909 RepID=A0A841EZB5_9BACT|nr:hypothetical protein [Arcicella rosea]MBB6005690.1 hypothetical protein [Arcicella rosea]